MDRMIEAFFPDGARVLKKFLPGTWHHHLVGCSVPFVASPEIIRRLTGFPVITFPAVMLFAVGGVMVGSAGAMRCNNLRKQFSRDKKAARALAYMLYSFSFGFFALMNVSAIIAHSLFPPHIYTSGLIDARLIEGVPRSSVFIFVSHVAHVLDICSTCCSCMSFVVGRLYDIRKLDVNNVVFRHCFLLVYPAVYCIGFVGLNPSAKIPFLGEVLYPGVCGLMPVIVPMLEWPSFKLPYLLMAVVSFGIAFSIAVFDGHLCTTLGPHWTTPAVCFAMCDVMFVILAKLIDV